MNHHYVPEFFLDNWAQQKPNGQRVLSGYFWNAHKKRLWLNENGVGGFCYTPDGFRVKSHDLGTDVVETTFFAHVDLRGQKALAKMLSGGVDALTIDDRSDFIRFFLSLEARQPEIVQELRTSGAAYFANGLDGDQAIADAIRRAGINMRASEIYERQTGMTMGDIAMLSVQSMTDNKQVGGRILNGYWHVRHLERDDGHCVLSDRPMVRTGDFRNPTNVWALPLTPSALFVCASSRPVLEKIKREKTRYLVHLLNSDQAVQATKYVFSTVHTNLGRLERRVRHTAENPRAPKKFVGIRRNQ